MKTPCIKNSEYKFQAKKKKIYNFSLLVPYPIKFVVVCICIVIFHGIYSPLPTYIVFCGGLKFFSYLFVNRNKPFFPILN